MEPNLITLMIAIPALGAAAQALFPFMGSRDPILARWVAIGASVFSSFCGLFLVFSLDSLTVGLQFREVVDWVGSYGIAYDVGIDGISALLILLVAIVFPLLIVSEWSQKKGPGGFHGLLLLLQTSLLGVVCSQNLFLTFFFWALTSLPIYFMLAMWGDEEREKAAFRFMMSASLGNALFFIALVLVYYSVEPHTFSIPELLGGRAEESTFSLFGDTLSFGRLAFIFLALGMAFRAPIWPVHGWFSYLSTQAPAAVAAAIAGTFIPVAIYVFGRLTYSLFPAQVAEFSSFIMFIGAVNVVMGTLSAVTQRELRLVLAYICLAHTGFTLIGIGSLDSAGGVGVVYQLLTMGLGLSGFGLFAGLLRNRTGNSSFLDGKGKPLLGGISEQTPILALLTATIFISLLGFPGFGGFVGQSLIMMGGYAIHPWAVLVIGAGLIFLAYGLFSIYRFIFWGKTSSGSEAVLDLSVRERSYLFPIVFFILFLGIYPKPLLDLVKPAMLQLLSTIR